MTTVCAGTNLARYPVQQFTWRVDDRVGHITLDRPNHRNSLIFKPYAEDRDLCRTVVYVHGEVLERLLKGDPLAPELRGCGRSAESDYRPGAPELIDGVGIR